MLKSGKMNGRRGKTFWRKMVWILHCCEPFISIQQTRFCPDAKKTFEKYWGKTDVSSKDSPLCDATEGGKAAAHACQCHRNVQGSDVDQKTVQPDLLIELVTALRRRHDDKIPTHLSPHFRLTVTHLNGVYKQRAIKNIITVTACNEDVKSKKGSKSYLTEFALLPSAFMNTFTWSNGACTYIFNLKHKFGQKTDTHAVTTKVWTEIVKRKGQIYPQHCAGWK